MSSPKTAKSKRSGDEHNFLRQSVESMHQDLILGHQRSREYPSSVIGQEREVLIESLLSKVLPAFVRYGSGVIIDHSGARTGQVDLVLETPHSLSLPISSSRQRLYFAETVVAAIEVKSDLLAQQKEAFAKISEIKQLKTKPLPSIDNDRAEMSQQEYEVPAFIVAYRGASERTTNRIWHHQTSGVGSHRPTGLVTIDPGYFDGFSPSGGGMNATGPSAILAFILSLSEWISCRATQGVVARNYEDLLNRWRAVVAAGNWGTAFLRLVVRRLEA